MNVTMTPVQIIGLKSDLDRLVCTLRSLGCVQIDPLAESSSGILARPLTFSPETSTRLENLNLLLMRVEVVIEAFGCADHPPAASGSWSEAETQEGLQRLLPEVQALTRQREELQAELSTLPLYEATLRKLIPLTPPAARQPGNSVIGVLVNRANVAVLDMIGKSVLEQTRGAAQIAASDINDSTRAMMLVFPDRYQKAVEDLLGQKDISRLRMPAHLDEGLPDAALTSLQLRMKEIPQKIEVIDRKLAEIGREWGPALTWWRMNLQEQLDGCSILNQFGETDMTFVMVGWVPARELERVRQALKDELGDRVLLEELPVDERLKANAPVLMENPAPARPFESLIRLLALPRYGHIDPTRLMAVFLPIFFGMMLGDIGYGLLLLGASLFLKRKSKPGFLRDLSSVLVMGSVCAVIFGILYGEMFGTLGEAIGLHAVWLARDSAENVTALLIMSVAIGAGHVTLGLLIGVWEALKDRSRTLLLERGGMLIGLVGLFALVGVLVDFLPAGFMTPAVGGVIVGIVLLSASFGWLGLLIGPIEYIGLVGNVLSYLRIAAIGLASVYLAKVANMVAGTIGNIIVGLIVAVLIHALNLVMGVFSPSIHSLRLHYVEFFRKFYEGGGRPFEPFRSRVS